MFQVQHLPRKNSRKYVTKKTFDTVEALRGYCKENSAHFAGTPYIFTHIKLDNGEIITQTVIAGKEQKEITVSPERLAREMQSW